MTRPYHTRVLPDGNQAPFFKRSLKERKGKAPGTSPSSSRRFVPCPDAVKFLEWIEETLPSVVGEEAFSPSLDRALLLLTKEYLFRRQTAEIHQDPPEGRTGFICLPEVYHQKATELFAHQLELLRAMSFTPPSEASSTANPPEEKPTQHLFIGEEIEDND